MNSVMLIERMVSRRIFSQGSSMDNTNVDSNHMRQRQKKSATGDLGGRAKLRSGLGGGNLVCVWVAIVVVLVVGKVLRSAG